MDGTGLGALAGFVVANVVTASSGALFRPGDWYEHLNKPWWRPPNWLFGPAWSVLYLMNSFAGWYVWSAAEPDQVPRILTVYGISLVFNAAWSGIFFGLRRMDLALVELIGLWASIALMIFMFRPISETAAWLLVPYLAWVSFAGVLNFTMWRLNPRASVGAV
jgi:tryptophan-rich sensory protein